MESTIKIPLTDLSLALAAAADLMSPAVAHHHRRVMYITQALTSELALPTGLQHDTTIAASLHDIGAFSAKEREDTVVFGIEHPQRHAEIGYMLLRDIDAFAHVARLIRYHHVYWDHGTGADSNGSEVLPGSHVIHLADRIDVAIDKSRFVLDQVPGVTEKVARRKNSMFVPEHVEAFERLATLEYFWLDIQSPLLDSILRRTCILPTLELSTSDAVVFARQLSHLIDYKSPFTSVHTEGVAAVASALAELLDFSPHDQQLLMIASYLHDLGKLAIPAEILEKPAKLTPSEFAVIQSHPYHSRRILESIPGFEPFAEWAASHHEHLDGSGYPFHTDELSRGARVVAVADVFTAVTENRPYRDGMTREDALDVLACMVDDNKLDGGIVEQLLGSYGEIDAARREAQSVATERYNEIYNVIALSGASA